MSTKRYEDDRQVNLTPAMIEAYKRRGLNQSDIAEIHGVTRQRVSQIKHQTDRYTRTPRELARDIFPFKVPKEPYQHAAPDKRLRDHAELMVAGVKGLSFEKKRRLRWFYEKLKRENLIVEFDLSNPPTPGIKQGGYIYAPRKSDDGDYLVRFNEDCELTEEQRLLWRFPPIEL